MSQALYKGNRSSDQASQFNGAVGHVVNYNFQGGYDGAFDALRIDAGSSENSGAQVEKCTGMTNSRVSFGEPGSYFASVNVGTKSKRICHGSQRLKNAVDGVVGAGGKIRWLSLGPAQNFAMTYDRKEGGISWSAKIDSQSLKDWIAEEPKKYQHLRVVFGPGDSYLAWQPGKGTKWKRIPEGLVNNLKNHHKLPSLVALGANGAYIVTYPDGKSSWSSLGDYPGLKDALREKDASIASVALDPYGTYYYIQFADGKVQYSAPWERNRLGG